MKDKVVYLHKKKNTNEVFYVGMGDIKRPYNMNKKSRSKKWWNAVEQYGIDVEIINTDLSFEDARIIEEELIHTFGRQHNGGQLVNICDSYGGNGMSLETRTKISNTLKGRPVSEEKKKKISENLKGRFLGHSRNKGQVPWNKGLRK